MFDKLIESEPQGTDFKDRRRYFMVSSAVVGILFTTAVVISIFAADYGLGNGNLELVEMIAPIAPEAVAPEVREPKPQTSSTAFSTSDVPSRRENMARTDEPTIAPTSISTTPNAGLARPNLDRFKCCSVDSNPSNPNGSGRETGLAGPTRSGLSDLVGRNDNKVEPEDTTPPPPVIKKPVPQKAISKGVLNGSAKDLPKPNYSATARLAGAQGQVVVQVTIDESGRVISANAVSGHIMLRADAERAARNARFSPTLLSDVPVKVTGVITYNFVR